MQKKQSLSRKLFLTTLAGVAATALAAGAAPAAQDVLLTAVKGDASVQDSAISGHAEIGADQKLATGDDGNCSVLVDRNAVVELCGQTHVAFTRNARAGNRIVNIESGTVRLVVEPREPGERIEIHTPAAIATILGTVVYVTVDPVTGATTISSSQSQVNIRSRDEEEKCLQDPNVKYDENTLGCAEGETISALEQMTILPDAGRQEKKALTQEQVDVLGGCLLNFHDLALEDDRIPQETKATNRVVGVDIASVDLPPVETGPPEIEIEEPETAGDVLTPQDSMMEEMTNPLDELEPCAGGVPGDHCSF